MYFNNKNNFFHGIMFHHFHDDNVHRKSQGSISKDQLNNIIKFIGKKNIINAYEFYEKLEKKKLKENEVCFTFDDAIKGQIDIALPVLEDFNIKSFFFVYTSIFENIPDNLEVFRYFRINYFDNVNEFYKEFYNTLDRGLKNFFNKKENIIKNNKYKYPHYSIDDLKFQLVRDLLLSKKEYENILFKMMEEKKFIPKDFYHKLFFSKNDLITIDKLGHLVGLHSHSHPYLLENLNFEDQKLEYENNISLISKILNKEKSEIKYMSHPCGSYNQTTLNVLQDLGIQLGFKEIMNCEIERGMKKVNNSNLEVARHDHALIIKNIEK
tara:strand:- start:1289 stop:2260 length:972 start_codon:yes stop_codon:yes gene_type:complete